MITTCTFLYNLPMLLEVLISFLDLLLHEDIVESLRNIGHQKSCTIRVKITSIISGEALRLFSGLQ